MFGRKTKGWINLNFNLMMAIRKSMDSRGINLHLGQMSVDYSKANKHKQSPDINAIVFYCSINKHNKTELVPGSN